MVTFTGSNKVDFNKISHIKKQGFPGNDLERGNIALV